MALQLSARTPFSLPKKKKKKNGLQLEGREIGYAKASVHDQITEIKLMYDRISVCGAIMGYLN